MTDTFSMAAASEQLAGKKAQEGVKGLSADPHEDLGEFSKNDETKKDEKKKDEATKTSQENGKSDSS